MSAISIVPCGSTRKFLTSSSWVKEPGRSRARASRLKCARPYFRLPDGRICSLSLTLPQFQSAALVSIPSSSFSNRTKMFALQSKRSLATEEKSSSKESARHAESERFSHTFRTRTDIASRCQNRRSCSAPGETRPRMKACHPVSGETGPAFQRASAPVGSQHINHYRRNSQHFKSCAERQSVRSSRLRGATQEEEDPSV